MIKLYGAPIEETDVPKIVDIWLRPTREPCFNGIEAGP
jgi:hypothetical protein